MAMRFAEVFLRLGCSLVAWMVVYAYAVWLAALHAMACGPGGDEMHRLLLGLAPATGVLALMLRLTRPFAEIHRMLAWLGVPVGLLLVAGLRNVWTAFSTSNLNGTSVCGEAAPATWQVVWAPVQIAAIVAIAVILVSVWRQARRAD
jgi:hypothetical protein